MRSCRWSGSITWRRRPRSGGRSPCVTRHGSLTMCRRHDIADELRHAISVRRVHGAAEARDDETLGGDDDDILAERALGEEGVARPAMGDAIIGAKAVAAIGPEAGADADE